MEHDDKPIDREAWRRVLSRGADAPPRATDERIRAQARRALAPYTRRWWLPASLAASLLLAVLVVQWQYEAIRTPEVVTESEIAPTAREPAPLQALPDVPDRRSAEDSQAGEFAQPPATASSAPAREPEPFVPAPAMAVPPPAAAAAEEAGSPESQVTRKESDQLEISGRRAPIEVSAAPKTVAATSMKQRAEASAEQLPTPEQWYVQIEALRAAGRDEEAAAELEKLEAAYPGWLEQHLQEER